MDPQEDRWVDAKKHNRTPRNAAVEEDEPGEVTGPQHLALASLVSGSTVTAAAECAGVDRTTVHRWLRADFNFQAALNRARREIREAMSARLEDVAQRAVQTVCNAVEAGDARIAIALLRGLGFLGGTAPAIGTDRPAVLKEETTLAERAADTDRLMRLVTGL
jgi:hypothetical protein